MLYKGMKCNYNGLSNKWLKCMIRIPICYATKYMIILRVHWTCFNNVIVNTLTVWSPDKKTIRMTVIAHLHFDCVRITIKTCTLLVSKLTDSHQIPDEWCTTIMIMIKTVYISEVFVGYGVNCFIHIGTCTWKLQKVNLQLNRLVRIRGWARDSFSFTVESFHCE